MLMGLIKQSQCFAVLDDIIIMSGSKTFEGGGGGGVQPNFLCDFISR